MTSELNRRDLFALSTVSAIGAVMPKGTSALAPDAQDSACQHLGMISIKDSAYGATGNAADDATTAFVDALSAIGQANRTLYLPPGTYKVNTLTIPANINLRFACGAVLKVAKNQTVTINGTIVAGLWQIFEVEPGAGADTTGKFAGITEAWLDWFGTDHSAFNLACKSIKVRGTLRLAGHGYLFSDTGFCHNTINIKREPNGYIGMTEPTKKAVEYFAPYPESNASGYWGEYEVDLHVVALTEGVNGDYVPTAGHKLKYPDKGVELTWRSEDSIGIHIINMYASTAKLSAFGFREGVRIEARAEGPYYPAVAYNKFYIGRIISCKTSLHLLVNKVDAGLEPWINANTFYTVLCGGGNSGQALDTYGIILDWQGDPEFLLMLKDVSGVNFVDELNNRSLPEALYNQIKTKKDKCGKPEDETLTQKEALVEVNLCDSNWTILDGHAKYYIRSENQVLNVYTQRGISQKSISGNRFTDIETEIGDGPNSGPTINVTTTKNSTLIQASDPSKVEVGDIVMFWAPMGQNLGLPPFGTEKSNTLEPFKIYYVVSKNGDNFEVAEEKGGKAVVVSRKDQCKATLKQPSIGILVKIGTNNLFENSWAEQVTFGYVDISSMQPRKKKDFNVAAPYSNKITYRHNDTGQVPQYVYTPVSYLLQDDLRIMPVMPVRKTEDLLTSSFVVHNKCSGKSIVFPGWGMDYNKTDLGSQVALPYGFDGNKSCYKQNGVVITGDSQLGAFVSLHGATDPFVRTVYLHATSKNAPPSLGVKCRLYCFDADGKILAEEEELFWSRCRYVTSRLLSIERPINFSIGDGTDKNGGARYESRVDPGSYGVPLASEFTFSNDVDTVYIAFSHDSNTPSVAEPINLLAISSSALSMPLVTWLKDKQRGSVTKSADDLWRFPFSADYTLAGGFLEGGREIYNTAATSGRPTGWRVVNRRNNTVIGDAVKGAKTLTVSSIDGISNGDIVGYMRCDKLWDWTTINGEPVGNIITLTDALSENVTTNNEIITYHLVQLVHCRRSCDGESGPPPNLPQGAYLYP